MPRGMPRRVWSVQHPNTLLWSRDHPAWGAAGSHRFPSSRLGSEEGTGRQRGSLLPPGTPTAPDGALCCSAAAPAPLPPGSWRRGCPPSPSLHRSARSACSKPGCRAGERAEPSGGATTRSSAAGDAARGAGTPRNSGQWGGRAPTPWGPRWARGNTRSLQRQGGAAAPSGDVPSGDPLVGVGRNAGYPSPGKAGEASAPPGVKPQAGSPMP